MTVDELIDRLTEMPGYREVVLEGEYRRQPVEVVSDSGTEVVLS